MVVALWPVWIPGQGREAVAVAAVAVLPVSCNLVVVLENVRPLQTRFGGRERSTAVSTTHGMLGGIEGDMETGDTGSNSPDHLPLDVSLPSQPLQLVRVENMSNRSPDFPLGGAVIGHGELNHDEVSPLDPEPLAELGGQKAKALLQSAVLEVDRVAQHAPSAPVQ